MVSLIFNTLYDNFTMGGGMSLQKIPMKNIFFILLPSMALTNFSSSFPFPNRNRTPSNRLLKIGLLA